MRRKAHVDSIIERSVLSNGHKGRLVVSSSVDGGELVHSSGQSSGNISSKLTIYCSSVETLEEGEFRGVSRCSLVEGTQCLDDNVRVTDDLSSRVQLLRCSEVVLLGIYEVT